MKQTVVPNRNAIFSSILYGLALSISSTQDSDVVIALGVHSGDHAIYPDCRPEFYNALSAAFSIGNWDSQRVSFLSCHISMETNLQSLRMRYDLHEILGLDFDEILESTITSYNPDELGDLVVSQDQM